MKKYIFIIMLLFLITGCNAIGIKNIKQVQDNTLYSPLSPKAKIEINQDYKYIGNIKTNPRHEETNNELKLERYVFAKYDENRRIESAIEVLFRSVTPGYFISDIFKSVDKNKVVLNSIIDVNGSKYNSILMVGNTGLVDFYNEKGFIAPSMGFAHGIARNFGPKSKEQFQVWYWEDLDLINKKLKQQLGYGFASAPKYKYLDAKELKFMDEFIDRSKQAYTIKNVSQAELDSFNESAVAVQDNSAKLVELKKLMDQGVITQEDYDKKKRELLKEF